MEFLSRKSGSKDLWHNTDPDCTSQMENRNGIGAFQEVKKRKQCFQRELEYFHTIIPRAELVLFVETSVAKMLGIYLESA